MQPRSTDHHLSTGDLGLDLGPDGLLRGLASAATGGRLLFADSEDGFSIAWDVLPPGTIDPGLAGRVAACSIDARDCVLATVADQPFAGDGLRRVQTYVHPHATVELAYELRPGACFAVRTLRFTPRFAGRYLVRSVTVAHLRLDGSHALVPFNVGSCQVLFLRGAREGFFASLMTIGMADAIGADTADGPGRRIELTYRADTVIADGLPYEAEPCCLGAYARTGVMAPPVPEWFKTCRQSLNPPDHGESEAMLRLVAALAPQPHSRAVTVTLNQWASPNLDPVDPGHADSLAAIYGPCFYTTRHTWGGRTEELVAATPATSALGEPPASIAGPLAMAAARGLHQIFWLPVLAPHPWLGHMQYCPDRADWHLVHPPGPQVDGVEQRDAFFGSGYNCPANAGFLAWHRRLAWHELERGSFIGCAADEGLGRRADLVCRSGDHDHLPGSAGHAYFRGRRDFYRALRARFGGEFALTTYRPVGDTGLWEMLDYDTMFTLSEMGEVTGHETRYYSRIRHFYHFVPSWMDQARCAMRHAFPTDNDLAMLSMLAVSSNFLFYTDPVPPGAERIRFWLQWARDHRDHMRAQAVFLPDWPGQGRCDAYARTAGDETFLFVFNANDAPCRADLALADAGLDAARPHAVTCIWPPAALPARTIIRRLVSELPAGAAQVFRLVPA
jgi:hypothetical protein